MKYKIILLCSLMMFLFSSCMKAFPKTEEPSATSKINLDLTGEYFIVGDYPNSIVPTIDGDLLFTNAWKNPEVPEEYCLAYNFTIDGECQIKASLPNFYVEKAIRAGYGNYLLYGYRDINPNGPKHLLSLDSDFNIIKETSFLGEARELIELGSLSAVKYYSPDVGDMKIMIISPIGEVVSDHKWKDNLGLYNIDLCCPASTETPDDYFVVYSEYPDTETYRTQYLKRVDKEFNVLWEKQLPLATDEEAVYIKDNSPDNIVLVTTQAVYKIENESIQKITDIFSRYKNYIGATMDVEETITQDNGSFFVRVSKDSTDVNSFFVILNEDYSVKEIKWVGPSAYDVFTDILDDGTAVSMCVKDGTIEVQTWK